jgi:PAN domain
VCAARCERDKRCRAWSFSYPSTSGAPAMCWLKRDVVPAKESSCCVSGVRGAGVIEPKAGAIEYSIDRFGGDYRWFETPPDAKGKACAEACQGEQRCRAWTYRRPGYGAASARCFLKDAIKPPRHRPCCISGVVR